jgi:cell division protein FtsW
LGKGPGKSTQRYVLPHPYSDFIYTIIIEEYGLLGGVFVLMLYLWLFYRCIILVRNCTKTFTAISVGGLGLMISTQAGLHILVNVGILPVTGHTLPLISLGGTSFIIFSCAFGIILSVSRTIDIDAAKQEEERIRLKELQEQKEREKRERELLEAEKSEDAQQQTDEEPVFHDIIDEQTGEFK